MLFPFVLVTIGDQPSNETVCTGGDAVFTCVLAGLSITLRRITSAAWHIKKGGPFLSVSGRPRHNVTTAFIDNMLFDTLTVTNVSQEDEDSLYLCMVTSEVTSDIVSITVTGKIHYVLILL